MSSPYIGEIRIFAGNFAPANWAFCDGSLLAISQFAALFNLIGTTYGGDGISTFGLPNLLGRIPVHQGSDSQGNTYVIGQMSGAETVVLAPNQLPIHTHAAQASANGGSSNSAANHVWANWKGASTATSRRMGR